MRDRGSSCRAISRRKNPRSECRITGASSTHTPGRCVSAYRGNVAAIIPPAIVGHSGSHCFIEHIIRRARGRIAAVTITSTSVSRDADHCETKAKLHARFLRLAVADAAYRLAKGLKKDGGKKAYRQAATKKPRAPPPSSFHPAGICTGQMLRAMHQLCPRMLSLLGERSSRVRECNRGERSLHIQHLALGRSETLGSPSSHLCGARKTSGMPNEPLYESTEKCVFLSFKKFVSFLYFWREKYCLGTVA